MEHVVIKYIKKTCKETSFLSQQRKFATDEIMANSFSLHEISPYKQVVQDKSRS
jgi:hypothetical protein